MIWKDTRRIGIIFGALFSLISIPVSFFTAFSEYHLDTINGGSFIPSLAASVIFIVLPLVMVLPVLFFFCRKLIWHEYWTVIIFPLIAMIYVFYFTTCGFGTSSGCQLRYELKKMNLSTCETTGLQSFEKNTCYIFIASQTKNRDICTHLLNNDYDGDSGIQRCIEDTPYDAAANEKIWNYAKESLVFCKDASQQNCDNAVFAPYERCFNDHLFSHFAECMNKQNTQVISSDAYWHNRVEIRRALNSYQSSWWWHASAS